MIPLSDGIPARRFPFVNAHAHGGGTAFFAHVGGFLFGVFAARVFAGAATRRPAVAST